jgi:hypothetical protein
MPFAARVGDMHTCPMSEGPKPPMWEAQYFLRVVRRFSSEDKFCNLRGLLDF